MGRLLRSLAPSTRTRGPIIPDGRADRSGALDRVALVASGRRCGPRCRGGGEPRCIWLRSWSPAGEWRDWRPPCCWPRTATRSRCSNVTRPSRPAPSEAWEAWERRGVNQFRLLHFFMPRFRIALEQELPRVAEGARGGRRAAAQPHRRDAGGDSAAGPRPGDEDFTALTARRPVVEAVMAAAARATPGLTVRRGVAVEGLVAGAQVVRGVPHVTGVRTAAGRRSPPTSWSTPPAGVPPLPDWLESAGARRPVEELEDSGFVYYGRHFRSADGTTPAASWDRRLQAYGSVSILTLPADNGTWGVGIIASAADTAMRGLRDVERWNAVVRSLPLAAHWLDGEPLEDRVVTVMAKIEDRHRSFTVDGAPVATGVVAVADSWACTNPSLGRGASDRHDARPGAARHVAEPPGLDDPAAFGAAWEQATDVGRRALVPGHGRASTATAWPRSTPRSGARRTDPRAATGTSCKSIFFAAGQDPDCLRAALSIQTLRRGPPRRSSPTRALFEKALTLGAGWRDAPPFGTEPERAPVHRGGLTPRVPRGAGPGKRGVMRVDVGGVGIEYEVTGEGPPVVLLHGFPDSGRLWRHQVPALVEAGFSTIVPDLRGYGASDQPAEVEAYSIPYLAGDVVAILDAQGIERAHVVGHDWGAALAWAFGSLAARPGRPSGGAVGRPPRRRSSRRATPSARSRGTCCCSSSRASPSNGCRTTTGPTSGSGAATPTSTASSPTSRRTSRSRRRSTTTAPTCRPSRFVEPPLELPPVQAHTMGVWSSGDFALTEAQMTGSGAHVLGIVALRDDRGPRALDAARGSRCGERAPARLPARTG